MTLKRGSEGAKKVSVQQEGIIGIDFRTHSKIRVLCGGKKKKHISLSWPLGKKT
jgi:hypothetical protein